MFLKVVIFSSSHQMINAWDNYSILSLKSKTILVSLAVRNLNDNTDKRIIVIGTQYISLHCHKLIFHLSTYPVYSCSLNNVSVT